MRETIERTVPVEEYEPLEILVISFESEDVITASGDDGEWDTD